MLKTMIQNEGAADRLVRSAVGLILVVWAMTTGGDAGLLAFALVIGLPLIVTGAIGWCPFYRLLGINTLKRPH